MSYKHLHSNQDSQIKLSPPATPETEATISQTSQKSTGQPEIQPSRTKSESKLYLQTPVCYKAKRQRRPKKEPRPVTYTQQLPTATGVRAAKTSLGGRMFRSNIIRLTCFTGKEYDSLTKFEKFCCMNDIDRYEFAYVLPFYFVR
ncbi:hypothetical protein DPMN_043015 [Dreissena polymorpha]|uniref:Uncharacterized protein n=1 Tax=Dreissena polymorpha TaxID=45954 RepID=A0A9D4D1K2_DREPO|nr:hypothetical protein DPMN_043015 [Dreissena polymorpha]